MDRDRSSGFHSSHPARREPVRGRRANVHAGFLIRVFLLASVAVVASAWALVRFYTRVRPPMIVPVAQERADAGGAQATAGEIEVEVR